MFEALVDFFRKLLFSNTNPGYSFLDLTEISIFNTTLNFRDYLSILCSLVSLGFILVLCCLFVFKIIKLIGGLIR